MRFLLLSIACLFFFSCNSAITEKKRRINKVKKIEIDESSIVLTTMPRSLLLINDSTLSCIIDYKKFVTYNINSGFVLDVKNIDSILINSTFSLPDFIKDHCIANRPERNYITDKNEIEDTGLPFFKIVSTLSCSNELDSVSFLINILTPYLKDFEYKGEITKARWMEYSTAYINVNLNNNSVNEIIPIKSFLPEKELQFANPQFGCFLNSDKELFVRLIPDFDNKKASTNEVAIFNLTGDQKLRLSDQKYPSEFVSNQDSWIGGMKFEDEGDGIVLYNDIFDILSFKSSKGSNPIFSLKKHLNLKNFERVCSFSKLDDNNFVIRSMWKDSSGYLTGFRFYNIPNDTLEPAIWKENIRSVSLDAIVSNNKIIFTSTDKEHFYFEQYEIIEY